MPKSAGGPGGRSRGGLAAARPSAGRAATPTNPPGLRRSVRRPRRLPASVPAISRSSAPQAGARRNARICPRPGSLRSPGMRSPTPNLPLGRASLGDRWARFARPADAGLASLAPRASYRGARFARPARRNASARPLSSAARKTCRIMRRTMPSTARRASPPPRAPRRLCWVRLAGLLRVFWASGRAVRGVAALGRCATPSAPYHP